MFDQILGLPAHALIIHFAVVLIPLLVAVSAVYAVVPRWRTYTAWAVVLLSLAGPAAVYAALQSGQRLKAARFADAEGELGAAIANHERFANPLLWSVLGLAAAALLLVGATARGSAARDRFGKIPSAVLSVVTLALAAVSGFYVFQAGDSGARAVWGM